MTKPKTPSEALRLAYVTFDYYAALHRGKYTKAGDEKADANAQLADEMKAAILAAERLEQENAILRARVAELETPNLFWDPDNPEMPIDATTLNGAAEYLYQEWYAGTDDHQPETIELQCARNMPNMRVRCWLGPELDSDGYPVVHSEVV